MAREEEEEEEAMSLTYDRPELVNKVVFRRRLSTGTWEVFLPDDQASQKNITNKLNIQKKVGKSRKNNMRAVKQCNKVLAIEDEYDEESPLPSDCVLSLPETPSITRQARSKLTGGDDPDYTPGSEETRKTHSSSHGLSISPKISNKTVSPNCVIKVNCSPSSPNSSDSMILRSRRSQNQSFTIPNIHTNHSYSRSDDINLTCNKNDSKHHRYSMRKRQ